MKPIRALALLVAVGFTVAGCASGKKSNSDQHAVTLHNNLSFRSMMSGRRRMHRRPQRSQ